MVNIQMPHGASCIIDALQKRGFEAYIVGGCVRDSLLGLAPKDWDICTSATTEDVLQCFYDNRVIETGVQHGTVTVVFDDDQYEVTTFRVDGKYIDGRHPSSVAFVKDIAEDLARRDFTINAMAYNHSTGLIDLFGGLNHLKAKVISCVGDANDRFNEDALRIMRAMRFASVYGFSIADDTATAIHKNTHLLNKISAERINSELCKLLCGKGVLRILLDYDDVISTTIPEIKDCIGFEQNNPHHQYTVYEHIAHAVSNYRGEDVAVKIALLLHDIGKPQTYTINEGCGHFYGHGITSRDVAENVLKRLKFDNKTQKHVAELVLYHDAVIEPTAKYVRRWLNKIGQEQFERLICVREADAYAQAPAYRMEKLELCKMLRCVANEVATESQCFSMKDMKINGNDIMNLGVGEGKRVGEILNSLLTQVIDGAVDNDRDALLSLAFELANDDIEYDR